MKIIPRLKTFHCLPLLTERFISVSQTVRLAHSSHSGSVPLLQFLQAPQPLLCLPRPSCGWLLFIQVSLVETQLPWSRKTLPVASSPITSFIVFLALFPLSVLWVPELCIAGALLPLCFCTRGDIVSTSWALKCVLKELEFLMWWNVIFLVVFFFSCVNCLCSSVVRGICFLIHLRELSI